LYFYLWPITKPGRDILRFINNSLAEKIGKKGVLIPLMEITNTMEDF